MNWLRDYLSSIVAAVFFILPAIIVGTYVVFGGVIPIAQRSDARADTDGGVGYSAGAVRYESGSDAADIELASEWTLPRVLRVGVGAALVAVALLVYAVFG